MMGSNEIDFRIFYEKIKEDRVKLVDSIEADLQRVREVDELLERIARHHGFEHNGNGHVPTPEVQAPQKAAKIATIKAKDGTEERKYIIMYQTPGPGWNRWGFLVDGKKIPWREYLKEKENE
jgi:hypothetical protein